MKHSTIKTAIKSAEIDCGMAPLVIWLNQFDSVYSVFSCEGDKGENVVHPPYVTFYCNSLLDLQIILNETAYYSVSVNVEYMKESGALRYYMTFKSGEFLESFISSLKDGVIKGGGNYKMEESNSGK